VFGLIWIDTSIPGHWKSRVNLLITLGPWMIWRHRNECVLMVPYQTSRSFLEAFLKGTSGVWLVQKVWRSFGLLPPKGTF
jgi:hypothetical protein